jgi:hypothetical protein
MYRRSWHICSSIKKKKKKPATRAHIDLLTCKRKRKLRTSSVVLRTHQMGRTLLRSVALATCIASIVRDKMGSISTAVLVKMAGQLTNAARRIFGEVLVQPQSRCVPYKALCGC